MDSLLQQSLYTLGFLWLGLFNFILVYVLGTLAVKYEKLGGEVKWMGKPDKVIWSFCSLL